MPASPADSTLYRKLFGDDEVVTLFTDNADVRAMMLVEGALAKAQGALGVIPETAAAYLCRASHELQIDAEALTKETAVNGVPVPGLIAAFNKAAQAPDHTAWLHRGGHVTRYHGHRPVAAAEAGWYDLQRAVIGNCSRSGGIGRHPCPSADGCAEL